jgi:integrase
MPLRLKPPRPGKSPNWTIRGTYLRVRVDRTAGTPVEAVAKQVLAAVKRDIERGRTADPVAPEKPKGKTFEEAALGYIKAGGDARYLGRFDPRARVWLGGVIPRFIGRPVVEITQQEIDEAAVALYPHASAMTRNRHVYTPVSAVLKHAGIDFKIRRPKGWRGKSRVDWLQPEQAFRMLDHAKAIDPEFRTFLAFLLYTGCRLNEGLALTCDRLQIAEAFAYLPQTKNEDPRGVHLPPFVVAELANHPRGLDRGKQRVFRFRKCGRLYTLMSKVKAAAGPDVAFATFHTFCHTWATWMRRYAGLDTRGLVGTGRWRDQKSAARYEHVVASEESMRADLLPTPQRSKTAKSVEKTWKPKLKSVRC